MWWKLQARAFRAAPPVPAEEGALAAVAFPDESPHGGRDAAREGIRWPRRARAFGLGELRLLELLEQHGQRPLEDGGRIAVRDLRPEQVLDAPQLVVRLGARRKLHFVALGRERRDDRGT